MAVSQYRWIVRNGWRILLRNRGGNRNIGFSLEGAPSCYSLIQNCAKSKDIAALVRTLSFNLLGRHVLNGTD